MTMPGAPLSPFEIATGLVLGCAGASAAPPQTGRRPPREALEQAILPALLRPPCLVSFSGGRDSSAVLAVAATLARREGLPLPIAATNVFPGAPQTDESGWQEQVMRHLRLEEWVRIRHTGELDLIGPYAQRMLHRHGLLWPFNVHFHIPLLMRARGGSLLTGVGGDELFGAAARSRWTAVLARQERPQPRDLLRIALALGPRAARRAVFARREPIAFPWLSPRGRRVATTRLAAWAARAPRRLGERMEWLRRSRYLRVATAALQLTAQDSDTMLVHPLLSPPVWAAVATAAAPHGFAGRTEAMRVLFGASLPGAVCARESKAGFDGAFWTARSAAYARSADVSAVAGDWIEPAALTEHWRLPRPWANSFLLLQASWLAQQTASISN